MKSTFWGSVVADCILVVLFHFSALFAGASATELLAIVARPHIYLMLVLLIYLHPNFNYVRS